MSATDQHEPRPKTLSPFQERLNTYLRAGYPILYVVTAEEERAIELIGGLVADGELAKRRPYVWPVSRGLCTLDLKPVDRKTADPRRILPYLLESQEPGVFILEDFHFFLDERSPTAPLVIRQLRRFKMGPEPAPELQRLVATPVLEYARDLEAEGADDPEAATVGNERYWKAIFILGYDNTALFSRLVLLMRDGYLRRADMVLLHCFYDLRTDGNGFNEETLGKVQDDIRAIEEQSNALVREGIEAWDRLDRQEAVALYHKALAIYPKNPWALYELGLDRGNYLYGLSFMGGTRLLVTRDRADAEAAADPTFAWSGAWTPCTSSRTTGSSQGSSRPSCALPPRR